MMMHGGRWDEGESELAAGDALIVKGLLGSRGGLQTSTFFFRSSDRITDASDWAGTWPDHFWAMAMTLMPQQWIGINGRAKFVCLFVK